MLGLVKQAALIWVDKGIKVDSTFCMPNQLATSKRRQSLAEHAGVLTALSLIARRENTTVMALLREANA